MLRIFSAIVVLSLATSVLAEEKPVAKKPLPAEVQKWKLQLEKWVKALPEDYRHPEEKDAEVPAAAKALRGVEDEAVVVALAQLIPTERTEDIRRLLVEVACKFKSDAALELVVKLGCTETDKPARMIAVKAWAGFHRDEQILALLPLYIETEKFRYATLEALDKSGLLVQVSPGQQPNKVLVKTLIKHLYYHEKRGFMTEVVERGVGAHYKYQIPKVAYVQVENTRPDAVVLDSLKRLTFQDYGYDQTKWHRWVTSAFR